MKCTKCGQHNCPCDQSGKCNCGKDCGCEAKASVNFTMLGAANLARDLTFLETSAMSLDVSAVRRIAQ